MNKKVKKFFRRTKENETKVDIYSMNIVLEAERIIEEYVNKMGYRFRDEPKQKKHTFLLIFSSLLISALAFAAVKMFLV